MAISSRENRMWGHFEHSLDDKGRVIVPQKFRDKLGDEFVLTTGPSRHLRAYPLPIWDALEEQFASTDLDDELNEDSTFLQRIFGNCEFVSPDQQNRLSIPRHMRDWANLRESETAIILGSGTRLEFWSRANWDSYSTDFTAVNAATAASRRKAGIRSAAAVDVVTSELVRGDAG